MDVVGVMAAYSDRGMCVCSSLYRKALSAFPYSYIQEDNRNLHYYCSNNRTPCYTELERTREEAQFKATTRNHEKLHGGRSPRWDLNHAFSKTSKKRCDLTQLPWCNIIERREFGRASSQSRVQFVYWMKHKQIRIQGDIRITRLREGICYVCPLVS